MKGKDKIVFLTILLSSVILGFFIVDKNYAFYSDIVTFLSILVGFEITSLSILYHSPLKKELYNAKSSDYINELLQIKTYYKHGIYFQVSSVLIILLMPTNIYTFDLCSYHFELGKHLLVTPIIAGGIYSFYKIFYDLMRIFSHPTNP